jgi:hypothetical protein
MRIIIVACSVACAMACAVSTTAMLPRIYPSLVEPPQASTAATVRVNGRLVRTYREL